MKQSTSNRTALITGGARGIGRAIALALADAGCQVTATGRTDEEIDDFDPGGRNVVVRSLDVADSAAIAQLMSGFEQLDILVNSAGTIMRGGREHDPLEFAKVVDVNLTGTMRMCAACRALLTVRRGCVVNIASMYSFFGSGLAPAYSASKGGVAQLTKSLAIAWAADGVRVNAIAPGWIETVFTVPVREDPLRNADIVQRTPMRRWGQPAEVAGAAVFLCSPEASFITGVILPVDGGYSIA